MKDLLAFLLIAIVVLIGSLVEVAAQADSSVVQKESAEIAAGVGASARGIERSVFKQLIKLPYYGVFDHIAYKVEGDTVTLFGKVAVAVNKKDAERAVKRIVGVRRVVNQIEILPLSPLDDSIRRRTLRTLARGGGLFRYFQGANPSVRIIVDRGHLELEGYVATRGDYNLMNVLASGVTDVFSVKNNLIVEKEIIR